MCAFILTHWMAMDIACILTPFFSFYSSSFFFISLSGSKKKNSNVERNVDNNPYTISKWKWMSEIKFNCHTYMKANVHISLRCVQYFLLLVAVQLNISMEKAPIKINAMKAGGIWYVKAAVTKTRINTKSNEYF